MNTADMSLVFLWLRRIWLLTLFLCNSFVLFVYLYCIIFFEFYMTVRSRTSVIKEGQCDLAMKELGIDGGLFNGFLSDTRFLYSEGQERHEL